jgi:dTDP-glucose 4,6-dehydratase
MVHISSHQVYGNIDGVSPISENMLGKAEFNTVNGAYSEAKRLAETLCAIYRNQQQLPITIVRPFAFIGPYQNLDKPWAVNNFIRDALLGGPIRILGNGATIRSYLYSSDMAYWLLRVLIDGKSGGTYNLGSSESVSLNDLATAIVRLVNKNILIIPKSSKENYSKISVAFPDVSRIIKDVKVNQVFNLEEALQRTILWNQLISKV